MEFNKEDVKEICLRVIEMEEDEIGMDDEFRSFSHIDSLKALDLMTEIERHFRIKLPEKILRQFESISQVIAATEAYVNKEAEPA